MPRARRRAAGLALAACLVFQASPALAWGTLTHAIVAERAYEMLLPRAPWLTPHQEAFIWGAIAPGLGSLSVCSRAVRAQCRAPGTARRLWESAHGDPAARAFALGWAVEAATEAIGSDDYFTPTQRQALRRALVRPGLPALASDAPLQPLLDYAVDAALVPHADGALEDAYRGTVISVGTPAGLPFRDLLTGALGADDSLVLDWARLAVGMTGGGPERYLKEAASFQGIAPWRQALRSAKARRSLGDLTALVTRAADAGVLRAEALMGPK